MKFLLHQIGLAGFVTAVQQKSADVALIDCSYPALAAGQLASAWNIPMIGYATTSPDLSDKSIYSTFTRIIPPFSQVTFQIGLINLIIFI